MKKSGLFMLAILLILVMVLVSCSSTPSTTTTTANPPPATTAATSSVPPSATTTTAVAPATSLAAPTTTPQTSTVKKIPTGTLRVADQTFSYESFDPIFYESFWGWSMYDPLLSWDINGNIIGSVAESYSLSPDGKTWTFKIRKGIKFHNGDPLTASDVAFSVQRFSSKDSTNPWSPYLSNNYAGFSVPDDYTFIYEAKNPEPSLVIPFAWTRILPSKYFNQVGVDGFRAKPIGSGPFKFAKFISKTEMDFDANTDYWGLMPGYAHVQELLVPEESTRIAMLKRGDVDIIQAISNDRMVELQKGGFKLQEIGSNTLNNFNFQGTWLTTGPTKEKKFRMAMSYAVNRQEICDTFYKGLAKPGSRWEMDPSTYGWDPSWTPDPYDVAKAKSLLAEVGYPEKYSNPVITLVAQAGPVADLLQVLQGYWDAVGIKTTIKVCDPMTYGGLFFVRNEDPKGDNVGDVVCWIYAGFFDTIYHCANMYTSKGVHSTGADPQADVLYAKATSELDPVKAKQYWTEFQNYAYSMWVSVGVCYQPTYVVVGPKVGSFGDQAWKSVNECYIGIQPK